MSALPPLLMIIEGRQPRLRKAPRIRPREIKLHMATADILRRFAREDWRWTHFPAGEQRSKRTGGKLKRMGLQPGWPDFILVSPAGLFHALELKREGEDLNEAQSGFHYWLIARGIPRAVCESIDQVVSALTSWGALRVGIRTGVAA